MLLSYTVLLALLPRLCFSSCIQPRALASTFDDGTILNYALTFEYLKQAFYSYGLTTYGRPAFVSAGYQDPFYENLLQIYVDQLTHVEFWTGALWAAGIEPTTELQYEFPSQEIESFVTLAAVFEGVGLSA